jgi:hypothetical protein
LAKGADINPIENVWGDILKDSVYFRPRTDNNEVFQNAHSIREGYSIPVFQYSSIPFI